MSLVIVRKIQKGKWEDYCKGIKEKGRFKRMIEEWMPNASADAITNCLKTTKNELSIWIVEESHINDALLAMTTGSELNDVGTINYVVFRPEELKREGLLYKQSSTDANTAIPSLKQYHYDILDLTYKKLGKMQKLIVKKLMSDNSFRKTRSEMFSIIEQAIDNELIEFSSLSEEYIQKLQKKYPNKNIPLPRV